MSQQNWFTGHMHLTTDESSLVFSIMRDLSGDFDHQEVRHRVGQRLLELLNADYFASYLWDDDRQQFVSCVQINMSSDNLRRYEDYYQFHDPITPTLQRRKTATPVSAIMDHNRLEKTEFYNDFLKKDGLCYGINYFAYDRGDNIGDVRIWRSANNEDFSTRDAHIVDAIGPSFVNALVRAHKFDKTIKAIRFVQIADDLCLTKREAEIADLLVVGMTDGEICQSLSISKPTLRSHVGSIFRKTGLNRRTQLAQLLAGKNHHL
ncbi:MAG: helix-turn-helix transcriptional regulator [Cohaesibacteraceae bacterium]|nr:helix-turn-helix transcriptional regulator [Cohaesibacteraceae bacterium]